MEKKLTSRAKQALATKKKIYSKGIQLFKKEGYQNVSIEQIAKAAGVGVGTFYHHYESKIELFTEMFVNAEDFFEEFRTIDLSKHEPYEIFQHFFDQYVLLNESAGLEFAQHISAYETQSYLKKNREFELIIAGMIGYYQDHGMMKKEMTPEAICEIFFIAARGVLFDWGIRDGSYVLKDKMRLVMDQMISSFIL